MFYIKFKKYVNFCWKVVKSCEKVVDFFTSNNV